MPPATDEEEDSNKVTSSSSPSATTSFDNAENYNICPECKKVFPSPKSLYGHLRSHPNRGYRGAVPPKKKRGGPSEDQILAWPRRTKRARSRYDAKEETEAAMTLKILSMGPPQPDRTRNGSSVAKRCYKCTACGKSFSTHQALGGHTASHNKHKHSLEVSVSGSGYRVEPDETTVGPSVHRCEQCGKVFGSGQALGGHKREHYGKTMTMTMTMTGHRTAVVTNERRTGQVLNDFDLNEPPRSDAGET